MKPIGLLLRRNRAAGKDRPKEQQSQSVSVLSLEEQIAALEREIASDSDSDDESSSSSSKESDDALLREKEDSLIVEKDMHGNLVRIISSLQESDRIAPLPPKLLPSKQCRFADHGKERVNKRQKVSFADEPRRAGGGMTRTVQELLASYEPASHEKRPFYCRICKFQAKDLEEFEQHKQSETHVQAARTERNVCFCKLCRKQFTSPVQLKEHLKGKSHLERLEKVREAHANKKKFC